jgi:predicted NBD/HSP70 family sugar kinase
MNLTVSTEYVCGIDLHARKMRICVMDRDGKILLKRNLPCGPITSLVILYETHTIERFCTPQRYSSLGK